MRKRLKFVSALSLALIIGLSLIENVLAQDKAQPIQIPALQSALNTIIATIQSYIPLVIIAELVFLGLKLALSGDDIQAKNWIRTKGFHLILGTILIFGASYLTTAFLKIVNP